MKIHWLLVVGVVVIGCDLPQPTPSSDSTPQVSQDARHAYVAAREFCRVRLKSPSSAKFISGDVGSSDDYNLVAQQWDGGIWFARGEVDSQNSFGAMIRSPWAAQVRLNGGNWQLMDLSIDGQEVFSLPESAWPTVKSSTKVDESSLPPPYSATIRKQEEQRLAAEREAAWQQGFQEGERKKSEWQDYLRRVKAESEAMNQRRAKEALPRVIAYQHQQASNGYPSFQFELGKRYLRGDGVEINLGLARHWLQSACTNGESQASNLLRQINLQGAAK